MLAVTIATITPALSLDLTSMVAIAFIAIHLWTRHFHRWLFGSELIALSFSGGMAIAYLFMHLIPELEEGQDLLGAPIHLLTLVGFLLFYGLQRLAWKVTLGATHRRTHLLFCIQILLASLNNFLLIYVIPEQFEKSIPLTLSYVVAMGMHLLSINYSLCKKYNQKFNWGRYVLIAAVAAGMVTDILTPATDKILSNILTAVLAGAVMFSIFKEDLPEQKQNGFRWFLAGVILYVFLLAGSWVWSR